YRVVEDGVSGTPGMVMTVRPEEEQYVGSSIQFLLLDWNEAAIADVIGRCMERGVELKWFGGDEPKGFTSRYDSWRYAPCAAMPATDRILKGVLDMRMPLTFSLDDCALIARIIREEISDVWHGQKAAE
ncbi:MAG: aminotransferase, partial [Pseudomonadota bacterium]